MSLQVDRVQCARQLVERGVDRVALVVQLAGQAVECLESCDDVVLVAVEPAGEGADLVQDRPGLALAANRVAGVAAKGRGQDDKAETLDASIVVCILPELLCEGLCLLDSWRLEFV